MDIVNSNDRTEGINDPLYLVAPHMVSAAGLIDGLVLKTACYRNGHILNTAFHQRISLLPESSGRHIAFDESGIDGQKLYAHDFKIISAYKLTDFTYITPDRPVRIICRIGDPLLRLAGLKIYDRCLIFVVSHVASCIFQGIVQVILYP